MCNYSSNAKTEKFTKSILHSPTTKDQITISRELFHNLEKWYSNFNPNFFSSQNLIVQMAFVMHRKNFNVRNFFWEIGEWELVFSYK